MFINQAFAQTASVAAGSSLSGTIVQLVAIFAIFYFILIRPQQKAMKNHQALINSAKKGDKVITGGGVIGKVVGSTDDELEVEVAKDTVVTIKRSTLKDVILPEAKNDNKKPQEKKNKKAKK